MNAFSRVVLTLLLLFVGYGKSHGTSITPCEPKDFIGDWCGLSTSGIEFVRLELDRDGGHMAMLEVPDAPFHLYRIHWKQTSEGSTQLRLSASPVGGHAETIALSNATYDGLYSLKFRLSGKNWQSDFVLFKNLDKLSASGKRALFRIRWFHF